VSASELAGATLNLGIGEVGELVADALFETRQKPAPSL
jgi:hypothetical protein